MRAYKNSTTANNNSLERFGQACKMIQQLNANNSSKPIIDYAFDILGTVSQGNSTKWSIVYDLANKTIHFRTNRFVQIKTLSFADFDFNCTSAAKLWDMNQSATGNINTLFQNFSTDINRRMVETAAKESSSQITISEKSMIAQWQYAEGIKCR